MFQFKTILKLRILAVAVAVSSILSQARAAAPSATDYSMLLCVVLLFSNFYEF